MRSCNPGNLKSRGRCPEEVFSPGGRRDRWVRGGGHAGVALEGARVVDGEEKKDVAGGGVGGGEDGEVLFLGGPCALREVDIRLCFCR